VRLVGVGLLVLGGLIVWRITRAPGGLASGRGGDGPRGSMLELGRARVSGNGRYRTGPWPGLSPAGGAVLLGCALLLGGGQLVLGDPRMPWPDVPLLAILALAPMALATRLVGAPGAASAVCGAYLLPRALLSLVNPGIEPPPLLLVPALAFDVSAWLRASDFANFRRVTGGVTRRFYAGGRRRGLVGPRRWGRGRAVVAGAVFGGVLAAIEPAFAVLLGADASVWSGTSVWLAGAGASGGCAVVGLLVASGRDRAA
jgi:hypothetical protein